MTGLTEEKYLEASKKARTTASKKGTSYDAELPAALASLGIDRTSYARAAELEIYQRRKQEVERGNCETISKLASSLATRENSRAGRQVLTFDEAKRIILSGGGAEHYQRDEVGDKAYIEAALHLLDVLTRRQGKTREATRAELLRELQQRAVSGLGGVAADGGAVGGKREDRRFQTGPAHPSTGPVTLLDS